MGTTEEDGAYDSVNGDPKNVSSLLDKLKKPQAYRSTLAKMNAAMPASCDRLRGALAWPELVPGSVLMYPLGLPRAAEPLAVRAILSSPL